VKPYRLVSMACAAAAVLACIDQSPSIDNTGNDRLVLTAKSVADIVVSSVSPDSATQDTTLDVIVNGDGFVSGATAAWAFAGVEDSTQVRTNSTKFVTSRKLVANITISAAATVAKWDVVVTAAGKKGGIGSEAFTIKLKPNTDTNSRLNYVISNQVDVSQVSSTPNIQTAGIVGDGRLRDGSSANGGNSEYQARYCGSVGLIESVNSRAGALPFGMAEVQPAGGYTALCTGIARYFSANLDGLWTTINAQIRVAQVWQLSVGQTITTTATVAPNLSNCTIFEFDPAYGGSNISVTRLDAGIGPRQWILRSQPPHMGACVIGVKGPSVWKPTGKKYYLPFAITITEIPYPAPSYP
jgi:hypothetical protein